MPATREFEGTTIHCWESGPATYWSPCTALGARDSDESLLAWLPPWN